MNLLIYKFITQIHTKTNKKYKKKYIKQNRSVIIETQHIFFHCFQQFISQYF